MKFIEALKKVKEGNKVAREGWANKLYYFYPEGDLVQSWTPEGTGPISVTFEDIEATDWTIIE